MAAQASDSVSMISGNRALFLAALIGILFCRFQIDMQIDPDLFARMATGRLIVQAGAVPLHDVFAFTPTKPIWIDHEWLAGLFFFEMYEWGGEYALYLFKILMAVLTFSFLMSAQSVITGRERPAIPDVVWMLVMGCFISLVWHTTVRSQVFTYTFLAFELYALVKHGHRGEWLPLITLLLIMPIWANCHGGFVVGLGFLGIHTLCQWARPREALKLLLLVELCLLATLLNPYGIDYWFFIIEAISMKRELIREWAPVVPWSGEAFPLNLLVLVALFGTIKRRTLPALEAAFLLLISLYFAYRHFRFIPIPLMVGVVFFSDLFRHSTSMLVPFIDYIHGRLVARIVLGLVVLSGWYFCMRGALTAEPFSLSYRLFPQAATAWLEREREAGNILSSYRHGNYLLWRLYPRFKVAIDGRYEEVYTEEVFRRSYQALNSGIEGSPEALREIAPDFIIFDRRLPPRSTASSFGASFREIYQDPSFSILERQEPPQ